MTNATKLATLIDLGPRPVLRRQRNVELHLVVIEIQRMARGLLARRRTRLLPAPTLQRSVNILEPLAVPVVHTPVNLMPSPIDFFPPPPPVYRLTREDERRLITDDELDEWARNLEAEFIAAAKRP